MKKLIIGIVLADMAMIAIFMAVRMSRRPKPEDTVVRMQEALNDMDTKAWLQCFDQQTEDLYNGAIGTADSLFGTDLGAYSQLINGLGGLMSGAGMTPVYKLTVNQVEYSDRNTCLVEVTFDVDYTGTIIDESSDGELTQQQEVVELPMKFENGAWKVSMSATKDFFEGL